MTIFIGGMEIAAVLIILLAVVVGTTEAAIGLIDFMVGLFVVKNIIQTIIIGCFKNKNNLLTTAVFFGTDIVRMHIFFSNLKSIGTSFLEATGLRYFSALFGFILYFVICGIIFLTGEFISLMQAVGKKSSEHEIVNLGAMVGGIGMVLLLAFVTWLGYQ